MIHTLFVDRSFGVPRGTDFLFRGKKEEEETKTENTNPGLGATRQSIIVLQNPE